MRKYIFRHELKRERLKRLRSKFNGKAKLPIKLIKYLQVIIYNIKSLNRSIIIIHIQVQIQFIAPRNFKTKLNKHRPMPRILETNTKNSVQSLFYAHRIFPEFFQCLTISVILEYFIILLMDCQPYVNNLQPEFRAKSPELQNGPVTFRSAKDSWYILLLFVIVGTFIALSIYTISQGWPKWNMDYEPGNQGTLSKDRLSYFVGVVIGMAALSLLTSTMLIVCWRCCAAGAINVTILGMTLSLLVFSMVCFEFNSVAGGAIILVVLFTFLIMLCCCFSQHTDTADTLVSATGVILREASKMIVVPCLIMTIFALFFSSLLALSYAGIAQMNAVFQISRISAYVLYVALGTLYILILFVMYYSMSFLMGTVTSFWYTQVQPPKDTIGLKWLFRYNLGTTTFVSLIILVVKFMQTIVYFIQRNWDSKCMRSTRCISRGLSSSVSGLLHTLNNQAIIVSSYTGQSLIGSAKIASVLVYSCYPLFNVVRVIGNFLFFSAILFCVCLPTFISILIANKVKVLWQMSGIVGATVFLTTLMNSVLLSSLFLMFTLDYKLSTYGVRALPCHQNTRMVFQKLSQKYMQISIPPPSASNFAID